MLDYNSSSYNTIVNTNDLNLSADPARVALFPYHQIDHHGVSYYVGNPDYSTKLEMNIPWRTFGNGEAKWDYIIMWFLEGPAGTRPADIVPPRRLLRQLVEPAS